jgi:putative phosphoesterase
MRIGILSDTHDQLERTQTAVATLIQAGAELLIHCGDLTTPPIVHACTGLPACFVFGNCDHDPAQLRAAIERTGGRCLERGGLITVGQHRIAVTHGDSRLEVRRLLALEPDYLLTGHSHAPSDGREGRTRRINPGALHRAAVWSVAVLDLQTDHLAMLTIPNSMMQP